MCPTGNPGGNPGRASNLEAAAELVALLNDVDLDPSDKEIVAEWEAERWQEVAFSSEAESLLYGMQLYAGELGG